ncbi:MAG: metallophosphoesterase [bacterium]|nr:metallophosphoesterase [bacterium]
MSKKKLHKRTNPKTKSARKPRKTSSRSRQVRRKPIVKVRKRRIPVSNEAKPEVLTAAKEQSASSVAVVTPPAVAQEAPKAESKQNETPKTEAVAKPVEPQGAAPASVQAEKPAIRSNIERAIVVSNIRVPHQDEKAIQLCIMQSKDIGVDRVFFNGDIWDYFNRSHIDRHPLRVLSDRERKVIAAEIRERVEDQEEKAQEALNEEFGENEKTGEPKKLVKRLNDTQLAKLIRKETMERALRKEMEQLFGIFRMFREALPNAEFTWIYGCDEHYLVNYLTKNFPELLDELGRFCREMRIEQRYNGTRNNTYRYGQLEIGHWFRGGLSSPSAYVAHMLLDDEGVSLIQGHTNRGGWACRTIEGQKYISGYENFSLCKRPVGKNWQLGYSIVYRQRGRQRFQVYQVPIADYGFFWGTKEYQLDSTKIGEWELAIAISDIHIPFEDESALGAAFELIAELQPAVVFVNGDANDFKDISRFANSPHDALTDQDVANLKNLVVTEERGRKRLKSRLERELEKVYAFFQRLRKIVPNAKIIWIFGNHEFRMQSYIEQNAPHIAGMRRPGEAEDITTLAHLSRVKELGVEVVYSKQIESYTTYGELLVGHFYQVNSKSAHTARALLQKKSKSLIQPHVHRVGAHYKTRLDGKMFVAVEMGCLCRLDPEYMQNPNWQHGFVVIHKKKNSGRFYLQPIHIVDGAYLFGGKRYGRKSKSVLDPDAIDSGGNGDDDNGDNAAAAPKDANNASADSGPKGSDKAKTD